MHTARQTMPVTATQSVRWDKTHAATVTRLKSPITPATAYAMVLIDLFITGRIRQNQEECKLILLLLLLLYLSGSVSVE